MPGTFVIKPLAANVLYDKDLLLGMDAYCKFTIGMHSVQSSIAASEGLHPHWEDVLKLERKHDESYCYLSVKDKDVLTPDDPVGTCKIFLEPIEAKGRLIQWYSLYDGGRLAGEILVDMMYQPDLPQPLHASKI